MTGIHILQERPATSQEWDEAWESCGYATYFHSREWAEIWHTYTLGRTRPSPTLFLFSDGKKAFLPASLEKRVMGLVEQCVLSPAGNYGGWLSADSLSSGHESLLEDRLRNLYPDLIWRINPYGSFRLDSQTDGFVHDETHVLDLSSGYEAVLHQWQSNRHFVLRKVRKAVLSGVTVKLASDEADWRDYYEVYQESLSRWGAAATSRYGENLFREIRRRSMYARLWLTLCQGKVIGGVLCFTAKGRVAAWHGVTRRKFFGLYPVNLLYSEVIKEACGGGNRWFDLNPSGGHEGVKAFKKSFGATLLPCPILIQKGKAARWVDKIKCSLRFGQTSKKSRSHVS